MSPRNTPLDEMVMLSSPLAKLCEPLFAASPVAFYAYYEFGSGGTLYYLTSHQEFYERYVEERFLAPRPNSEQTGIYMDCFIRDHARLGFWLRDLDPPPSGIRLPALESLNLGHSCFFMEKTRDDTIVKVHYFLGHIDDPAVNHFYLNNVNLLTYFSRFISKEIKTLLEGIAPYTLPQHYQDACRTWIENLDSSKVSIPRFLSTYAPHTVLSERQREIIYWYMMGKTTEETALILGVTKNTINTYFERIKDKLSCKGKPQILAELLRNGVCFADLPRNESYYEPKT